MHEVKKVTSLIVALLIVGLSAASTYAAIGKRVALVIGNSAYSNATPLANPERDGRSVAAKLKQLGFSVVEGYDLDYAGFTSTIRDFSQIVRDADIGLVFYAGHGMQVNGKNYLVPVDAVFGDANALDFEAVPLDLVMRQMDGNVGVSVVILDACRNNPLAQTLARSMKVGTRSAAVHDGLAEVKISDAGRGTAIIYATSPDQVALDGEGEHSPFTAALLNHIDEENTDLQVVMSRITGDVYNETKQQQRPWMNASLTGEVILNPTAAAKPAVKVSTETAVVPPVEQPVAVPNESDQLNRETLLYNLARDSGQREDFLAYLETFPNGLFAANARKQIEKIDVEAKEKAAQVEVAAAQRSATPVGPALALPITDVVKSMPATKDTEGQLELDKAKQKELQARLNAIGYDVGTPDGAFGKKTRNAIAEWQASKGLLATGFFNQPQLEIFSLETESALAAYVPPAASAVQSNPRKVKTNKTVVRKYASNRKNRRLRSPGAEELGRFIGGVMIGGMRRFK